MTEVFFASHACLDGDQQRPDDSPERNPRRTRPPSGDQLHWKINSGRITVTKRPALFRWEGVIKHGPADVVQAVVEARKTRGRI